MPGLIVRVSPELIVKEDTVHVSTPFHIPPIATHDGPSERVPPTACASWIGNADNVKIKTAKTERYEKLFKLFLEYILVNLSDAPLPILLIS